MRRIRYTTLAALLACVPIAAGAQKTVPDYIEGGVHNTTPPVLTNSQVAPFQLDASGNLLVSGAFSATTTGFAPNGNFASLTASGVSASVALPVGATVVFSNTGTTAVSCTLGVGSATALVSENIIQPSSWAQYTVGSNTFGACIDQTGSVSNLVVLAAGTGLATGSGGGGGSGGSTNVPTSGGSTPQTGVVPVSPGYIPVQAFGYAFNVSTGRYDAMNLDGFENLKVSGGVSPGTARGTNPLGSPVFATVVTPGTYPAYTNDQINFPGMTPRGEALVMSGLTPLAVNVANGVTGATAQAAATAGLGGIPMLAATVSAGYGSGGGTVLTPGQINLPTITTSGATRVSSVAEAVGGALSFHLNGGTANSTNSTLVSTGPHTIYNVTLLATTTTAGFFRPYDSAAAPTCSSATGALDSFPTPVPAATPNAAGYTIDFGPVGRAVTSGLGFCFTGGGTDTDNTASGNTATYISITYK